VKRIKVKPNKNNNPFLKMSLQNLQHFIGDHFDHNTEKIHDKYHELAEYLEDEDGTEGLDLLIAATVMLQRFCTEIGKDEIHTSCAIKNHLSPERGPKTFFDCVPDQTTHQLSVDDKI
jgi:hypothetical protein